MRHPGNYHPGAIPAQEDELYAHAWKSLKIEAEHNPLLRQRPKVISLRDTHPTERRQKKIGEYMFAHPHNDYLTIQVGSKAAELGRRFVVSNPNLHSPGRLGASPKTNPDIQNVARALLNFDWFAPRVGIDPHDTPIPGDSSVWIHPDATHSARELSSYISYRYNTPTVASPRYTLSGARRNIIMLELDPTHPLNDPKVYRRMVIRYAAGRLAVPTPITRPHFTYQRDLNRRECRNVGLTGDRAPFSQIPPDMARELGLHEESYVSNWLYEAKIPGFASIALTPCIEAMAGIPAPKSHQCRLPRQGSLPNSQLGLAA